MHLTSVKAHRGTIHTPFRYPGGKSRLTGFLRRIVETAGWQHCTYLEPYAGGAGAALALLHEEVVPSVVINDLDPRIYAFWVAITAHGVDFLARFDSHDITLDEWHRQRDIYRASDASRPVELGFATFFMNRTNRSGIMNAGVIGGQKQAGTYKVDARFNRDELRRKLAWISDNAEKIKVSNSDGVELLTEALKDDKVFAYIDPPYFDKGSFLYMNSFAVEGHAALASILREARKARWVLTYDDVNEVRRLYRGLYQGTYSLPYSAHQASLAKERMVLSDPVADIDWVMA